MTQRSPITPADSVDCCHGAHRCILQTLCPVNTVLIDVFCGHFAQLTRWSSLSPAVFFFFCYNSLLASPADLYVAATAVTGVSYRLCHGIYLSPANTLLSGLSPVTPVDFLHNYQKLVNVYCRLGAMLQPARQCLLQTFCCSSRHRDFLQIYLSYCHNTQQCIFRALHTAWHDIPRCTRCAHCFPAVAAPLVS